MSLALPAVDWALRTAHWRKSRRQLQTINTNRTSFSLLASCSLALMAAFFLPFSLCISQSIRTNCLLMLPKRFYSYLAQSGQCEMCALRQPARRTTSQLWRYFMIGSSGPSLCTGRLQQCAARAPFAAQQTSVARKTLCRCLSSQANEPAASQSFHFNRLANRKSQVARLPAGILTLSIPPLADPLAFLFDVRMSLNTSERQYWLSLVFRRCIWRPDGSPTAK